MKYTAFATALIGLVIAGFAGIQYGVTGSANNSANPPVARLGMGTLIVLGVSFILLGAAMWIYGGRGYIVSWVRSRRQPVGPPKDGIVSRVASAGVAGDGSGRSTIS